MLDMQNRSKIEAPAHGRPGLPYVDLLLGDLARPDFSRKRHRTRRRLIAATAEVLQSCGLERLRVADIAVAADVSAGAFYVYFTDRTDVANQVLRQFADYLYASEWPAAAAGPAQLRHRISAHLALAEANGGLLRALGQATLETPDMADYVGRCRADWIGKTMVATSALGDVAQRPGHAELLDALLCGVLDRFASPGSRAVVGLGLADAIAEVWLATMVGPADVGRQQLNRRRTRPPAGATRAVENVASRGTPV